MMEPQIVASPANLGNVESLRGLAKRLGLEMRDIGVHNAHLFARAMLNSSPPLGKGMKLNERAGQRAIIGDLGRIIKKVSPAEFARSWPIDGSTSAKAFRDNKGNVMGVETTSWVTNAGQLHPIHQAARSKSTGRVSKAGTYQSVKNGRWRFINRAVADTNVYKEYLQRVFMRIGQLASGWLPSVRAFGAIDKIIERGSEDRVTPEFVSRHAGSGSFVNALAADGSGYASGTQNWRFGSASKLASQLAFVGRKRQTDMNGMMEKRLSKHVMDFNGRVTYAG